MSRFKVATNINIDLEFNIPSFHIRLLAWLIDCVIFILYFFLISKLMSSEFKNMNGEDSWGLFLILVLPVALYHVVMESTMNGQTIGKRLMHIKVINEKGGNATISQYIIRWLLRVSDFMLVLVLVMLVFFSNQMDKQALFLAVLAIVDIFCVALTQKSQRLGDMAAGTILINTKNKSDINETVFMEIEDSYIPRYPDVMKLSDRDMNMVKNIYNTVVKKDDYRLAARTADKIASVLNIEVKQDPQDFLETLLKDYNYISSK